MTATPEPAATPSEYEEFLARIRRSNAETEKFIEESRKLAAEARKLERDHALAPWQIAATTAAGSAALIGAGIALSKLFLA